MSYLAIFPDGTKRRYDDGNIGFDYFFPSF